MSGGRPTDRPACGAPPSTTVNRTRPVTITKYNNNNNHIIVMVVFRYLRAQRRGALFAVLKSVGFFPLHATLLLLLVPFSPPCRPTAAPPIPYPSGTLHPDPLRPDGLYAAVTFEFPIRCAGRMRACAARTRANPTTPGSSDTQ